MLTKIQNKKGFTIIELIVVMAIIGVLVLLAMPKFMGYTEKARLTEIKSDIKQIENASERYYIDKEDWPRLSDISYTSVQINAFAQEITDKTGQVVILDPSGKYYDIDYSKLQTYVQKPKNDIHYIIQNPVGEVFYLKDLNKVGETRLNEKQLWSIPYDDTNTNIIYESYNFNIGYLTFNGWSNLNGSGLHCSKNPTISDKIKFNFTGTMLRTYGVGYSGMNSYNIIKIDGIPYNMNKWSSIPNNVGGISFEKTDLTDGEHTAEIIGNASERIYLDKLELSALGVLKNTTLPVTITAWKLYDDQNSIFTYVGGRFVYTVVGGWSGLTGTGLTMVTTATNNDKIQFKFTGSKIRTYGVGYSGMNNGNAIVIDGIKYNMKTWTQIPNNVGGISFEKLDLIDTEHTVEILGNGSQRLYFDGVQVDGSREAISINDTTAP